MTFDFVTKHPQVFSTLATLLLLCASSFSTDVAAKEPTMQEILKTPALSLAQDYLRGKLILSFLSLAKAGVTIQLSGETIAQILHHYR